MAMGDAPKGDEPPSHASPTLFADRYEVQSLLGTGGMGTVYLARDRNLDELVALKVLRPDLVRNAGIEVFRREVKLARRVTHINVARVFDLGDAAGTAFLTMEYVPGPSLARLLERPRALALQHVVRIGLALCAGLDAAHKASVIHRDLKPDNVLIEDSGRVVITDFGIARAMQLGGGATMGGAPSGTPAYMAPEQALGLPNPDGRIDLYALGVVLFEALTGSLPFEGDTPLAVATARLTMPPPDARTRRADLPESLARLVLKCMAREREDRYRTAAEVAEDLDGALEVLSERSVTLRDPLPPTTKSVAVLAFRHADVDADAILAEGLWADLHDALSMTNGLRVRPRSDLASLRHVDATDLGRRLGADVVITGSVRRSDGRIRVGAKLISVVDGILLWSGRFEGEPSGLFPLTDEIATAIAKALTVSRTAPSRPAVEDASAIDLYMRARRELRRAYLGDPSDAVQLFEAALERAPDNPTFLSGYALASVSAWFHGKGDAEHARSRARWASSRALQLAPDLADARHALALCLLHDGEAAEALVELCRVTDGLELSTAHETLGTILHEIGLVTDAKRHLDLALAIDPTSSSAIHELARLDALQGRWAAAEERLSRLAAVDTASEGVVQAVRARFAFWRRETTTGVEIVRFEGAIGPVPASVLQAIQDGSDPRRVREAFELATTDAVSARRRAILQQVWCELACVMQRRSWALAALDEALAFGLIDLTWLLRCPLLDVVRDEPGYASRERTLRERAARITHAYGSRARWPPA